MKNKNRIYRVASLLLVLCFISTVMISGTFAKYTSVYSGQDTALVARWSFGGFAGQSSGTIETSTGDQGATLALFDHAYTTHINQKNTDGTTYLIAPGVEGSFVLKMDYIADVDADVMIAIDPLAGNANVPVEYSVDGGANWKTLAELPGALATKIIGSGKGAELSPAVDKTFRIAAVADNTPVEISETVKWRWPYEASAAVYAASTNAADTVLGEESAAEGLTRTSYGIKITLKATQVAPGDAGTPITAIGAITGTAEVGATLTAGAITPAGAFVTYQWLICDTEDGDYTGIAGATGSTYKPVAADVDKFIKVTATGNTGYKDTVTSGATAKVTGLSG